MLREANIAVAPDARAPRTPPTNFPADLGSCTIITWDAPPPCTTSTRGTVNATWRGQDPVQKHARHGDGQASTPVHARSGPYRGHGVRHETQ